MSLLNRFFSFPDSSGASIEKVELAETSTSAIHAWLAHSKAAEWSDFYASEIFIEWARELRISIALQDKNTWDLTGRAALVVSDQKATAVDLFKKIASDAGMNFFEVPASQVADLVPELRS